LWIEMISLLNAGLLARTGDLEARWC